MTNRISSAVRVVACPRLEEGYTHAVHPSGLCVLVSEKDLSTYHASLRVRYGSTDRYQPGRGGGKSARPIAAAPMGLAHFLEHKMFERVGGSYDDDFAALGAEVNAYTSDDRTAYMFSCTEHFPQALEALLRMVTSFSVTAASVARERDIIAEELRMNADDPWEICHGAMRRALYSRHPVREEICGTEASLRRITPRLLRQTFDAYYTPAHMVLSVCGRTNMQEVLAVVDRVLGDSSERDGRPLATPPDDDLYVRHADWREPALPVTRRVKLTSHAVRKPIFSIGIKAPPPSPSPREALRQDVAMTVLADMLFSHSAPFYDSLFEAGAISPDMAYGSSQGRGYAYFSVSGECHDPEAVGEAYRDYINTLRRDGLSREEFRRARRILYADYITGFDSTEDIAASLGGYAMDSLMAAGDPPGSESVDLFDFLTLAESITLDEVEALFRSCFAEERTVLVSLSPADASSHD